MSRLILLTAGNEPKLARIIRPRRVQAGWLRCISHTSRRDDRCENPRLRGTI
jgi:hypothetical protein